MDFFMRILHGSGAMPFLGSGNQQNNTHQSLSFFIYVSMIFVYMRYTYFTWKYTVVAN